jgi:penicillin amidase
MARLALDDALVWNSPRRYGTDPAAWRWGDAHQAPTITRCWARSRCWSWFVNIRQSTSGGDHTLMRGQTAATGADAVPANVHAAGYRGVYDFADPDSSVFIQSTGQSGHPCRPITTIWASCGGAASISR